jgi:hypothetical protein
MSMPAHHHFPSACSNAKPPINHSAKHKQCADVSSDVAAFLASGGTIDVKQDFGYVVKELTYKERNDLSYKERNDLTVLGRGNL